MMCPERGARNDEESFTQGYTPTPSPILLVQGRVLKPLNKLYFQTERYPKGENVKKTSIISLYNHKGGVSKTTTTFNLGWKLADKGKKVLLVDTDPQCNLTGLCLSLQGDTEFETFYIENPKSNIYNGIEPAFSGNPEKLTAGIPADTLHPKMKLLAGHIDISTFEPELSMAQKLIEAMPILQNLPGAFGYFVNETANINNIDIVLIDMSPSVGALNQNILSQSDFFVIPTSPDYFCYMAINSLKKIIPGWQRTNSFLRKHNDRLTYKLPANDPKFIGFLSQKYRPRSGKPSKSFQSWIDRIGEAVNTELVPVLRSLDMVVQQTSTSYELAQISDFNSLIAKSQEYSVPIFNLTDEQLGYSGTVQDNIKASAKHFDDVFSQLADKIIGAISNA